MENKIVMNNKPTVWIISDWLSGIVILIIGILNMFLVHPVPGIAYLLISLIYFPPTNTFLKERFGLAIPLAVKIILGIFLFMFTFGVSDLGDMIDKL